MFYLYRFSPQNGKMFSSHHHEAHKFVTQNLLYIIRLKKQKTHNIRLTGTCYINYQEILEWFFFFFAKNVFNVYVIVQCLIWMEFMMELSHGSNESYLLYHDAYPERINGSLDQNFFFFISADCHRGEKEFFATSTSEKKIVYNQLHKHFQITHVAITAFMQSSLSCYIRAIMCKMLMKSENLVKSIFMV